MCSDHEKATVIIQKVRISVDMLTADMLCLPIYCTKNVGTGKMQRPLMGQSFAYHCSKAM
jgi:hypothetical protein